MPSTRRPRSGRLRLTSDFSANSSSGLLSIATSTTIPTARHRRQAAVTRTQPKTSTTGVEPRNEMRRATAAPAVEKGLARKLSSLHPLPGGLLGEAPDDPFRPR